MVPEFTNTELTEAMNNPKLKKAPGHDGIPPEIIKLVTVKYPELILNILNDLIRKQEFSNIWKNARLVLVLKPGKKPDDPTSYRPLCIIDAISKIYSI